MTVHEFRSKILQTSKNSSLWRALDQLRGEAEGLEASGEKHRADWDIWS